MTIFGFKIIETMGLLPHFFEVLGQPSYFGQRTVSSNPSTQLRWILGVDVSHEPRGGPWVNFQTKFWLVHVFLNVSQHMLWILKSYEIILVVIYLIFAWNQQHHTNKVHTNRLAKILISPT